MNVYTDPKVLDVAGAMEALPNLPLTDGNQREQIAVKATGTDNSGPSRLVPNLVPAADKSKKLTSVSGNQARWDDLQSEGQETQKTPEKQALSEVSANRTGRIRTTNQGIMSPLL